MKSVDEPLARNLWQGTLVRLAGLTRADLPILSRWHDDSGLLRLLEAEAARPRSEDELARWLDETQKNPRTFSFAVRRLEDDALLGVISIEDILWQHAVGWLSISIGDHANWGKGYGGEAMRLVLDYAFRELNLHRVQLTVFEYNVRAILLYEKLGFRREGVYREFMQRDGRRHDMYLYGLLSREWMQEWERRPAGAERVLCPSFGSEVASGQALCPSWGSEVASGQVLCPPFGPHLQI